MMLSGGEVVSGIIKHVSFRGVHETAPFILSYSVLVSRVPLFLLFCFPHLGVSVSIFWVFVV